MISPELQSLLGKVGVDPNLYRQEPRRLPPSSNKTDDTNRLRRRPNKIGRSNINPKSGPLNIGPLEEHGNTTSRIEAIKTQDTDNALKTIFSWIQNKSIDYPEFEDLLAEVFVRVAKKIR